MLLTQGFTNWRNLATIRCKFGLVSVNHLLWNRQNIKHFFSKAIEHDNNFGRLHFFKDLFDIWSHSWSCLMVHMIWGFWTIGTSWHHVFNQPALNELLVINYSLMQSMQRTSLALWYFQNFLQRLKSFPPIVQQNRYEKTYKYNEERNIFP